MILTGPEIERRVAVGYIRITPFDPARVNPASVDLTLGPDVFTYDAQSIGEPLDPRRVNAGRTTILNTEAQILLQPGRLYLMHTAERVWARDCVPVLDGKSTLGRCGVSVHQTAGYGDPGFDGQYTLEVTCIYATWVWVGMPIAQIRFHETTGTIRSYEGKYRGLAAMGAVPGKPLK